MFTVTAPTTKQENSQLEQLLAQVAQGDRTAMEQLYHRTRAAVYAMALSVVKNAHDAQDVTQDSFVRIWEEAGRYRAQGSPMAWILTVTRNLARMRLRSDRKLTYLEEEQWNAIPAEDTEASAEDRAVLQDALAGLSAQERQIVLLHAVTGLKHREIARLLELPLATVLSKYHRARKKMIAQLEGADIG